MRLGIALLAVLAALAAAPSAFACACCADDNQWSQYRGAVDMNEIGRVQFARQAQLFGGADRSDGIRNPKDSYPLRVSRSGRAWKKAKLQSRSRHSSANASSSGGRSSSGPIGSPIARSVFDSKR